VFFGNISTILNINDVLQKSGIAEQIGLFINTSY